MNTHKPFLSDNALYGRRNKAGRQVPLSGLEVRDYYERLIAEGKLRVVEPCEPREDPEWPGMRLFGCNGRGPMIDEAFCPYCGGSIPPTSYEIPTKRDS